MKSETNEVICNSSDLKNKSCLQYFLACYKGQLLSFKKNNIIKFINDNAKCYVVFYKLRIQNIYISIHR